MVWIFYKELQTFRPLKIFCYTSVNDLVISKENEIFLNEIFEECEEAEVRGPKQYPNLA